MLARSPEVGNPARRRPHLDDFVEVVKSTPIWQRPERAPKATRQKLALNCLRASSSGERVDDRRNLFPLSMNSLPMSHFRPAVRSGSIPWFVVHPRTATRYRHAASLGV